MKKAAQKRLAVQFGILFVILAAVSMLTSSAVAFFNQRSAYHAECIKNLQNMTSYLAVQMYNEADEFAHLKEFFSKYPEEVQVPLNFRDDMLDAKGRFYTYFREHYPGDTYGVTVKFDELDHEAQRLYVNWRFEKWFIIFFDATSKFGLSYVYYIYPDETKDRTMIYMFDPTLETRMTDDGREILDLGISVYEDPKLHKYMWEAWDQGKAPNGFDRLNNEFGNVYTYCMPLILEDGTKTGLVCAEISIEDVNDAILISVVRQLAATVVILLLTLFFLYRFLNHKVLNRIDRLEKDVAKYSDEKDPHIAGEIRIHKGNNDELGSLSEEFADMIGELDEHMKNLQTVTAEKERIGAELNVATKIQSSMLPRIFPPFPERQDIDLYASMTPAKEVGGDFYDFFLLDDDHMALVIADVSGKGVPAALFMVIAKTLIKNHLQAGESVEEALKQTNNQLSENNDEMLFVTAWVGVVEISTGRTEFCDAGHETAYLLHPNGTVTAIKPSKKRPPLACVEGLQYIRDSFTMGPSDRLFIYTDGVPEATSSEDELYGTERLEAFLAAHTADDSETLLEGVHKNVNEFVGEAPQFDDLTMLAFAVRREAE